MPPNKEDPAGLAAPKIELPVPEVLALLLPKREDPVFVLDAPPNGDDVDAPPNNDDFCWVLLEFPNRPPPVC